MSAGRIAGCKDVAPLLVFFAIDEVSPAERDLVNSHLADCQACVSQLREEREFATRIDALPQSADQLDPAGTLLARNRSELAETLDDLAAPKLREDWLPFGWVRRWMALRPMWSGVALVGMGIFVGVQVWPALRNNNQFDGQPMNVLASPRLSDAQLANMAVSGISFSPSPDAGQGTVKLQLSAEQPIVLSGNVDDSDVRRVLTFVVRNGDKSNAGVRLDCIDALKSQIQDATVRQALLAAVEKDQNPAVRMKALEALRDSIEEDEVRGAVLQTLQHDSNPSVRVAAVNVLVGAIDPQSILAPVAPEAPPLPSISSLPNTVDESDQSIQQVVMVLKNLRDRDPNQLVRTRSAAALRQIGPREVH